MKGTRIVKPGDHGNSEITLLGYFSINCIQYLYRIETALISVSVYLHDNIWIYNQYKWTGIVNHENFNDGVSNHNLLHLDKYNK